MRPKKHVVLLSKSLTLAFTIETRGKYIVHQVESCVDALDYLKARQCDALIVDVGTEPGIEKELIQEFLFQDPQIPRIVISQKQNSQQCATHASCWIPAKQFTFALLLDYLRIAIQRKRGPKKAHSGQFTTAEAATA